MKIALVGYGKMGHEIESIALENQDQISFKITSRNLQELDEINAENTDVAIEFSKPDTAFQNISKVLNARVPVVSGTTAWLEKLAAAKQIAEENKTALFYAPNFSLGVNLFFELNKKLALMMSNYAEYKVDMEEIHHTEKLDAPSGTAVKLAEELIQIHPQKTSWINSETENENELDIISKRISGVPGTHSINYRSSIDEISISHVAFSRKGFAKGAWMAAHFIKDKKGFFEMKDLLNL